MFICDIDNNILNSGARFSSVYQDKSEKSELYQEINICGGLEPNQKNCKNSGARYSCNNQHSGRIFFLIEY